MTNGNCIIAITDGSVLAMDIIIREWSFARESRSTKISGMGMTQAKLIT